MTSADEKEHRDPAIEAFIGLLERDISSGKNVRPISEERARSMLAYLDPKVDYDESIEGEVVI